MTYAGLFRDWLVTALYSGVFRISVRRVRYVIGVEGVGCSGGSWALSQKKNSFFNLQNDKFGCILIFDAVCNRQKTPQTVTRSLGTRILRFSRETKLTKQCKNYPKIHNQSKGGSHFLKTPLPLCTACLYIEVFVHITNGTACWYR